MWKIQNLTWNRLIQFQKGVDIENKTNMFPAKSEIHLHGLTFLITIGTGMYLFVCQSPVTMVTDLTSLKSIILFFFFRWAMWTLTTCYALPSLTRFMAVFIVSAPWHIRAFWYPPMENSTLGLPVSSCLNIPWKQRRALKREVTLTPPHTQ